jgi:hypothetical protein
MNDRRKTEKERMKVQIYTCTHILTGFLNILPKQRLLDMLNGPLRGALHINEEFLSINESELCSLNGTKVTLESAYVNKTNILFAREVEDTTGKTEYKLYPFVSKTPIAVRLYLPLYTLTGDMYLAESQRLPAILNSSDRFSALTKVQILSTTGTSESVPFVAVNMTKIHFLEEVVVN